MTIEQIPIDVYLASHTQGHLAQKVGHTQPSIAKMLRQHQSRQAYYYVAIDSFGRVADLVMKKSLKKN